jgi:dCTP deaminase
MVLVDHQIREEVRKKTLGIKNFDEACLQPASYDLRIGSLVYSPSSVAVEKPVDLSKNGGAYRIVPYGSAVLTTFESLRMPNNMVGRFGLKSGFARRGLFASVGPQVDPGFEGNLFISVLNLTPASHVVSYKETFLSIEFQKLLENPQKTYDGPYQHKHDINPEILADLVKFEGINLSQMQTQFGELSQHVKEWSGIASEFKDFLKQMTLQTNALMELSKQMKEGVVSGQKPATIEARRISLKEAREEILSLFLKKHKLFYSDIAEELQLDYEIVIKACEHLQKEGRIEGVTIGKKTVKKTRGKH